MVQRTSDAVQFGAGSGVAVQQSSLGNARLDFDKYKVSTANEALTPSETSADRILGTIAAAGGKLADQKIKLDQQEAYLDGAAKAGTVQSEKDLDGNIFTKAWQTAGYRDTMGRVAIAENESRIMRDMPKLREASPEKFNEYLAERRSELMPQLEGMSLQQRQSTFQNLLMNDRSAIKLHTTEHIKFQAEVENRSIQGALRVSVGAMNAAKADGSAVNTEAYDAATAATFSTAMGAIVNNHKLLPAAQGKLIHEFAAFALSNDHQALYRRINEDQITLPDGEKGTMSSMMSWDDSVKLSTQYRESLTRTEAFRSQEFMVAQGKMLADFDNPLVPMIQEKEMLAVIADGAQRKLMGPDQQKSFSETFYKARAKRAIQGDLAAKYSAGDTAALLGMDKTDEEGQAAWNATVGRQLTPDKRIAALMDIGIIQGRHAALTELGRQLAPGIAQIGITDKVDPANAASLVTVIAALDAAEKGGKAGVFEAVMSTYPDAMQSKIMSIREGARAGLDPVSAIMGAQRVAAEEAKITPQQRKAMGESSAKDDAAFITELDSRGMMGTLGLKVKSIFSRDAANKLTLTARQHWMENPERVAEAGATVKYAAMEELRYMAVAHPFMSAEARHSSAMANLSARTIDTEGGPLIIPRGTTMQKFFGVPAETARDRIGVAMNEAIKPADGNRIAFDVVEGKLMFKELNKAGQVARSGQFDPTQVAPMVKAQQDREVAENKVLQGAGSTHMGVTFNGENTAGLPLLAVYNMRKAMLTSGVVKSEGAAVNNPAVNAEFNRMSDKAAQASKLPMQTTGKRGDTALALFGELNIRTGNKFTSMKEYRPLLQSLAGSDPVAAVAALVQTPVFKKADPTEQARLTATIHKVFKE